MLKKLLSLLLVVSVACMIASCDIKKSESNGDAIVEDNNSNANNSTENDEKDEEITPEKTGMSEEEWSSIFDEMSAVSNMSFTSLITTYELSGGTIDEIARSQVEIAENAIHEIITEGDTVESYYTQESGSIYRFMNQSGNWIKETVNHSSIPTIQMFNVLSLFKDMYNSMSYDFENNVYVCKNIVQNDPYVGTYTIYEVCIKFENDKISQLYYVIDAYMDSFEPTKTAVTYTFDNYGTTIVTLPTNYTESDSNE